MENAFLSYLITDPKYYSSNPKQFREKLIHALDSHPVNMACFRDKESSNFEVLAKIFVDTCRDFQVETILINGNYALASKLDATGVHLTSEQFDDITQAKAKNLFVVISCHSFEEIKKAQDLHADAVTFSPIFDTPNKGKAKGIDLLKEATQLYNIDIIALGGIINKEEIQKIKKAKAKGFASIRYFIDELIPLL
ncbi:MAG: thiamine phosphate synthase [Arcobacteraceae bacterium]